ncbi:DUF721 domain-containing protein [Dysgonomonas sp. 25]|uniref:DUF721 domain-containing protein n=1 Tax=Dysgonomonas sp. 25 TaxID=2302933 RepID=UPI0013D472B9|nr:DUF721 domain-containing protein [Dysgonomonas sp. 25]NDV68949.1 DUF721 domain-containing protein [Dysgonomonas sp. 25]
MRKKNTETIGEALKQFFSENAFFRQKLAESRVVSGWPTLLGKAIASYTTNIYIRNNILYVHLSSSVLRSELIMAKEHLINKLNSMAGLNVVNDIIFR